LEKRDLIAKITGIELYTIKSGFGVEIKHDLLVCGLQVARLSTEMAIFSICGPE